jgi:hypothetical protein
VPSGWVAIDALVQDIGELCADVHLAERTLPTDPRTTAARHALDRATDAVCTAIDEASDSALGRASSAIAETRFIVGHLGLTLERHKSLANAPRTLRNAQRELPRLAALTRRKRRRPKG